MIHVIAVIKAVPGERDTLMTEFRNIVAEVLAKPGCREYSLAVHLQSGFPGQAAFDENELIIVEQWENLEFLKSHIADPRYQAWFSTTVWKNVASASMQVFTAMD